MITVSTEVIQQSIRPDNFMTGTNRKNNSNRKVSDSDFDSFHYNTSHHQTTHYNHKYISEEDDITDSDIEDLHEMESNIHKPESMTNSMPALSTNLTTNLTIENTDPNTDSLAMSFEKVDIQSVQRLSQTHKKVQKSGLSAMIINSDDIIDAANHTLSDTYNRHIKARDKNTPKYKSEINIDITMLFSEFNFDMSVSVHILIFDSAMTVEQAINQTIHKFESVHPLKKLRSYNAFEYELRCVDDDDVEDGDLDEDELDPPLKRSAKICNFVDLKHSKNKTVYMVMCCDEKAMSMNESALSYENGSVHVQSKSKGAQFLDTNSESKMEARRRAQTMEKVAAETKLTFLRVYIPGPISESSVVLSIHNSDLAIRGVRDLFTTLNRKRKAAKFNAQYFDFYYKHKCKQFGAISNSIKVGDLLSKELIILPKILSTSMGDVNEAEAYQFELVKLANEHKRFKAFKIDKYRQKKKAFLLEIDRYRFVKTSLESSSVNVFSKKSKVNQMKVPVQISDIISVVATEKANNHNKHHNQFTITYSLPHNNDATKTKTYELPNTQVRDEIVDKLNFLCVIRRLQG